MLPPFIIEQIRRREKQQRERQENSRPRVQLPIEQLPVKHDDANAEDDADRGVIVVDLLG
jgi:hypothetical protein